MAKHALDTNIAKQFGVNIALLLESFQFWTFKNLARKKHVYDGLCWSYDTLESLGDTFSYWTRRQIEHTINNAVKHGLLVKGNYNQTKYDRTVWYALTPKAYAFFPDLLDEKYMELLYSSISQNCEIDYTNFRNGFPKIVTPIPFTTPVTDPDINIGTSGEVPDFDYTEFDEGNENKKNQYGLKDILNNNIFQIPEQMIQDWIANRKKKRAAIIPTAWNKINKELTKCKEQGIDPVEAFETMVASGWQSLKIEYFLPKENLTKQEAAKKRSIELEQMAQQRKQREINDAKRINRITSEASERERNKLRNLIGLKSPESRNAKR